MWASPLLLWAFFAISAAKPLRYRRSQVEVSQRPHVLAKRSNSTALAPKVLIINLFGPEAGAFTSQYNFTQSIVRRSGKLCCARHPC